jgi:hypothetical protein
MMDKSAGDSFKEKIAGDQLGDAAQRRVHQSLGRPLSAAEEAFADALMQLYADGVETPEAIAEGLNKLAIAPLSSDANSWTAELLHQELQALNADLDKAYQENGYNF